MGMAFVMGAQLSCQQTFVAIGAAKHSLFLALFRKIIVLIPLIYILPHLFENKVFAVFLAEPKGTMTLRPKRTSFSYFSGTEYVNSPSKGTANTTLTHFTFLDSP